MAAKIPVLPGHTTDDCSVMAWGFDADMMSIDPLDGAYRSVITSAAKLTASGCDYRTAYLSLQEYFEKLRDEPARWGKPFAALLGALDAQLDLNIAAIGGKDSMSGSFLNMDVPPTLISFAIAPAKAADILSAEFKEAGHPVCLFAPRSFNAAGIKACWEEFSALHAKGMVKAAWAVENSVAEALMNMSFGNGIGFRSEADAHWYCPMPGAIVAELTEAHGLLLGFTTEEKTLVLGSDHAPIDELLALNEAVLEDIYPNKSTAGSTSAPLITAGMAPVAVPCIGTAKPKVVIPVFPGTNCEYDSAMAVTRAGLEPHIIVLRNQSAAEVSASAQRFASAVRESQIIFIPGGFSGGDEPEGSGKFITAFFRNPEVTDATMELLKQRDGLMLGICNGFQALIKLGLVPYGEIIDTDENCPTLSFNVISRHQSKIVRTRVASCLSPWLKNVQEGDIISVPVSHGEGRFLCDDALLNKLRQSGQIATQYVDLSGMPSMDVDYNPNGSIWAIEGITSPDGRVLGKMGHSERTGDSLYKNVPGNYNLRLFESARDYFHI
ncbi:MAG: phosphoribosylformylglycinamidine synthase subunit PurQ, partial [Mailhella sp.]